jgi:membrane associated rhomboid family serine protease
MPGHFRHLLSGGLCLFDRPMVHFETGSVVVSEREKIINLPQVITALICVFAALQLIIEYGPETVAVTMYRAFAFIPARLSLFIDPQSLMPTRSTLDYDAQAALEQISATIGGGRWSTLTLVTYAFLHGNWTHLAVNALTLAAFGSPVARRLGDGPFLAFLACGAVAGALAHFVLYPLDMSPMVGASAGISAAMAAIVRFAFAPGAILGGTRLEERGASPPAEPLTQLIGNRSAIMFVLVWFGTNALFGAFPQSIGSDAAVAWEAHVGGFVFGLLSFGLFEKWARRP